MRNRTQGSDFSSFSPHMTGLEHRSPKLRVCVAGNGKGVFLVAARVRLLVKPPCSAGSLLV